MQEKRGPGGETGPGESASGHLKDLERVVTRYADAVRGGRGSEAREAAVEALILASEESQRNPSESAKLKAEAAACETNRDWPGAEAAYRRLLRLASEANNYAHLAKAQLDLSRLSRLLRRRGEASEFASLAVASARRANMFPVLVMTLENAVSCAIAEGRPQEALTSALEMLQVIEPDKVFDSMRARALICHAWSLAATGDATAADLKLAASWDLLQQPGVSQELPGVIHGVANWWQVKSQVLELQGELEKAQAAIARSIEIRRKNDSPYSTSILVDALENSARLAHRTSNVNGAESAQAEADSLRADLRLPV